MHIKFLAHGRGSTQKAVRYLLRDHDNVGDIRPSVEVLRGNPQTVADLGDSLKFKHRYRSAVISWADSDQPTEEQKLEVLDEFERLAFAGLESDQYHYLAVDHGNHVHVIVPRVELSTGKSMNIAPPGWQKVYDPLRDHFNEKYEWKSPDIEAHPENARLVNLSSHNIPKTVQKAKEAIHTAVIAAIEEGIIENREDMESWLGDLGEITRRGKDYISLKPEGFNKAMKMKGAIYERNWEAGGEDKAKEKGRERRAAQDRERRAGEFHEQMERIVERRSIYNKKRYGRNRSGKQERAGEVVTEAIAADITAGEKLLQGDRDTIEEREDNISLRDTLRHSGDIGSGRDDSLIVPREAPSDRVVGSTLIARRGGKMDINRRSQESGSENTHKKREINDRVRTRIEASLGRAGRAVQIKLRSSNEQLRGERQKDSGERRAGSEKIGRALLFYRSSESINSERVAKRLGRRKYNRSVVAIVREIFNQFSNTIKIDFGRAIAETVERLAKHHRSRKQSFNRWGSGMKM